MASGGGRPGRTGCLLLHLRGTADLPFRAPHAAAMLLADRTLAPAGNVLHSTLDLKLQQTLERQIQSHVARERRLGIANASAMLLDTRDMSVRALVGSADFFDTTIDGQVNGAQARRSPGSTLKPFIYGLALDQGLLHPLTVLKDAPTAFGPFTPENFDGRFAGPIPAREALIKSRNVPAVAVSARLAQPTLYQFLRNAGVARMQSEKHYGLGLALGGGEVTMENSCVCTQCWPIGAWRGPSAMCGRRRAPAAARFAPTDCERSRRKAARRNSGCYRKKRASSSSTSCATIRDRISRGPQEPAFRWRGRPVRHGGFATPGRSACSGPTCSRCGSATSTARAIRHSSGCRPRRRCSSRSSTPSLRRNRPLPNRRSGSRPTCGGSRSAPPPAICPTPIARCARKPG